jgi:tetratricopeptide (TPR) repeat protein
MVTMRNIKFISVVFLILAGLQIVNAQNTNEPPPPRATPTPLVIPTPRISDIVSKNLGQIPDKSQISRERREQAYAKLLEGQRYIWNLSRSRSQAGLAGNVKLAKQSLLNAVELNPTLAEGYTALAELTLSAPPNDLEEAILLANIAVKIDAGNFGGHRILARLYTIKSRLNSGTLDEVWARKAISEWEEVGRLDSRNAEAFAFLSEFYARTKMPVEHLNALRKWVAAVAPLPQETRFYRTVFNGQGDLSPDNATVKYGNALLEAGETREAVEVLSRAVADNPDSDEAIELLRRAVESADATSSATAILALQQAVFANPENVSLIEILSQIQVRAGKIDEATKVLQDTSAKLMSKNRIAAAVLQIYLGDVYLGANRIDEAVAAYQNALTTRTISENATNDERDFAIRVFDKMIEAYKKANRLSEAKAVIERARVVLGKADLFADKRLITFYLQTGKKAEALQALRALRQRQADDYALLRLEATILAETGKIDEAVALVKSLIGKKPASNTPTNSTSGNGEGIGNERMPIPSLMYDDFSNYLFIANLYNQAKRGKEAIEAVNQASTAAQTADRKEIARLTLATIQQSSGDIRGAEETLRGILKQSPRNPIALNNLGYFLTEREEKLDEALKLIEQAVEIDPLNPSFLDSLGWIHFKLGNLPEAEKHLKEALRFDDASPVIHEHLGDVYQKQGKLELAKISWQKALNLSGETDETNRIKAKLAKGSSK